MKVKKVISNTPPAIPAIKDKNGEIILMGNKVKDAKGKIHKIENVTGVAMLVYPVTGKRETTTILRKVDFTKFEKTA